MKVSDLFIRCLEAEGVETIFGLPGEENADFMISLLDSKIQFILCRHEQTAAFMADVYGRLTGKAGVCLGTLGPGATNLVTGVADGNMDHAPMVVITGQADTERLHKESHQAMNVVDLFRPITKWNYGIIHRSNVPEVIRKAFKIAEMEKPGACHIELPENIAKFDVDLKPLSSKKVRRPAGDAKAIQKVVELIRSAKEPIVLAGNGAVRKRATEQLREFAHKTGIGVVNTFMGKGVVPRSDPHCLFTMGLQSRDLVSCLMEKSDLVICVGYDLVEYHPRFWNLGREKKIVHIDFEAAEVEKEYNPDIEVVGDIANSLWQCHEIFADEKPPFNVKRYESFRQEMVAILAEHAHDETKGSLRPQKVLWDVREVLGPNDILLSDVGAHKMWIGRYYPCDESNTCLISNGFCSMGFALPGALAAKMVHPDRKVLAICGDGGALMNIQDLETAVRLKLAIVVMIWEDGGYGLIQWKQQNEFKRHSPLAFGNPNWQQLAESFGAIGMRVENAVDLKPALEEAFRANQPVLLSLPIDYRENLKMTEKLGSLTCKI